MVHNHFKWVVAAAILPILTACGATDTKSSDNQVSVGALLPFSGEAAFIGEGVGKFGAGLAIDVANDHGGVLGSDVKLFTQDDQRRSEPTISGLRAIQSKDVTVGIGPSSATIPAAIDLLKKSPTPWIPIGSTAVLDTGLQDTHVWRNFASDSQQLPAMLLAAAEKGGNVGLVFENNASGQQQMETVKKFADAVPGINIVDDLLLAPGQASYQSEASSFFRKDYDAVLWQLTDASASGFFKSAQQVAALSEQYFVGTDAAISDSLLGILKPYLGKATFVAVTAAAAGPGREKFVELYKEKYGEGPVVLSDVGYDATTLLLLAVEAAGSKDPDKVAAKVAEVATAPGKKCVWYGECAELIRDGEEVDFDGAMNALTFDDTHNVISDFSLIAISPEGSFSGEEDIAFKGDEISAILEAAKQ